MLRILKNKTQLSWFGGKRLSPDDALSVSAEVRGGLYTLVRPCDSESGERCSSPGGRQHSCSPPTASSRRSGPPNPSSPSTSSVTPPASRLNRSNPQHSTWRKRAVCLESLDLCIAPPKNIQHILIHYYL